MVWIITLVKTCDFTLGAGLSFHKQLNSQRRQGLQVSGYGSHNGNQKNAKETKYCPSANIGILK